MNPTFLIVVFFLLLFISVIIWAFNASQKERRSLIEELWTDGKITDETYKEYINK